MKLEQESSKFKNFIEKTPKSPYKPISKLYSTNIIFSRKINLAKNDYFKDFGLKKKIKLLILFFLQMKKLLLLSILKEE